MSSDQPNRGPNKQDMVNPATDASLSNSGQYASISSVYPEIRLPVLPPELKRNFHNIQQYLNTNDVDALLKYSHGTPLEKQATEIIKRVKEVCQQVYRIDEGIYAETTSRHDGTPTPPSFVQQHLVDGKFRVALLELQQSVGELVKEHIPPVLQALCKERTFEARMPGEEWKDPAKPAFDCLNTIDSQLVQARASLSLLVGNHINGGL